MTDVAPIAEGVNAVYRVELADGDTAVVKCPTVATDEEDLVEPKLLSLIGRETGAPVPEGLASGTDDVSSKLVVAMPGRRWCRGNSP